MSKGRESIKFNMTLKMVEEVVSFIYPLVTSMYVLRTLGTHNIGEIKYVSSILSYFSMIAGLGIGSYAAREGAKLRDDRVRFQKFSNDIFTISFASTAFSLVLLIGYILIFQNANPSFNLPLYILGAIPLAFSVVGRGWINTVYEDFAYVTIRYLFSSVVSTILIFLFVKRESDYLLYVFMLNALNCFLTFLNHLRVRRYSMIGFSKPSECKQHMAPIMLIFFSGIATKIYLNSDVTLLGVLVNNEAVAVYSVAATLYSMVKQVSNSVIGVTIPRLAYYTGQNNEADFNSLITRMIDYVCVIVFPSTIGLLVLNSQAMVFLGGVEYASGGYTLCILSLALPFAVLANILAQGVLLPRKKERLFLFATVVSAVLNISLNFVFIPQLSHFGAAITTLLSEIVVFIIMLYHAKKLTRLYLPKSTVYTIFVGCIAISIICELVKRLVQNVMLSTIISVILGVTIYVFVLILRKHPIVNDVKALLMGLLNRVKRQSNKVRG